MKSNTAPEGFTRIEGLIKHEGYVSGLGKNLVTVTLFDVVDCANCQVKGACGMAKTESKSVQIETAEQFSLSQKVTISMNQTLGLKAVFWAYVMPFAVMIATLALAAEFYTDWLAGLISLGCTAVYFTIVHKLKNRFGKAFKINILKLV